MNIKSFRFFCTAALGALVLQTQVTHADIMTFIDATWARACYQDALNTHGKYDAQDKYQQLGREAIELLRLKKQVPHTSLCIKKLAPTSPSYSAAACHQDGVIFVNEEHLEQQKIGMQRLTIFHEHVHLKQFLQNPVWRRACNTQYKSAEHEADLEAAKMGNCWQCTMEFSAKAVNQSATDTRAQKLHTKGYATKEEFLALAARQKSADTRCQYHQ